MLLVQKKGKPKTKSTLVYLMLCNQVPKPHHLPLKRNEQTKKQRNKQITPEPKQKQQKQQLIIMAANSWNMFIIPLLSNQPSPRFDDFFTHFHVTPETHRAILPEHGDAAPRFPRIDGWIWGGKVGPYKWPEIIGELVAFLEKTL